jgi:hypothetical protein
MIHQNSYCHRLFELMTENLSLTEMSPHPFRRLHTEMWVEFSFSDCFLGASLISSKKSKWTKLVYAMCEKNWNKIIVQKDFCHCYPFISSIQRIYVDLLQLWAWTIHLGCHQLVCTNKNKSEINKMKWQQQVIVEQQTQNIITVSHKWFINKFVLC